jgi:hypothetical protein
VSRAGARSDRRGAGGVRPEHGAPLRRLLAGRVVGGLPPHRLGLLGRARGAHGPGGRGRVARPPAGHGLRGRRPGPLLVALRAHRPRPRPLPGSGRADPVSPRGPRLGWPVRRGTV